jgi:hypothetical protein
MRPQRGRCGAVLGVFIWLACGCVARTTIEQSPVANAGADQTVAVDTVAQLDGTASTDPLGDPLAFRWTILAQPLDSIGVSQLDDPARSAPQLTNLFVGIYVVGLRVTASSRVSPLDTVAVRVTPTTSNNHAPVANAGWDGSLCPGERGQLNGTRSYDIDCGTCITSYLWEQVANNATTVTITDADKSIARFTAPAGSLVPLLFRLTVSDGQLASSDEVSFSIQPVVARASVTPGTVAPSDPFTLSGADSCYPDSSAVTYVWQQVFDGTSAPVAALSHGNLSNPDAAGIAPTEGGVTLKFELWVRADGNSDSDRVSLTVTN